MSRTRREKEPDMLCNFTWEPKRQDSLVNCAHVCRLPLDHYDKHFCCGAADGRSEQ